MSDLSELVYHDILACRRSEGPVGMSKICRWSTLKLKVISFLHVPKAYVLSINESFLPSSFSQTLQLPLRFGEMSM